MNAATNSQVVGNSDLFLLHECRDAVLLPGWFEDWVIFEQNRLQQDRLRAFTVLSRKSLAAGDSDIAAAAAEAALEIEPLYEDAVRNLISAELKRGSFAAALRVYERFRKHLANDMALVPSESLQTLIAGALSNQTRARREA
ncbi:bacterial transcriptional activator domain-containing protein [Arthrobacter sp. SAFR-044]|uniref:bacterial transcriptional activator domain-containing protein n=1 Tax=Arthrobacter sp. SAFR-044 TaxID=3387278 RepID=UPI003F7C9F45